MKNKFRKLSILSLMRLLSLSGCGKEDSSITPSDTGMPSVSESKPSERTTEKPSDTKPTENKPTEDKPTVTPSETPSKEPSVSPTPSESESTSPAVKEIIVTLSGDEQVVLGKSITLTALVENSEDTAVIWTSENEDVLKVENGVVTGLKVGKGKIVASSHADPEKKAEKEITVVDSYNFRISENKTYTVEAEDLDFSHATLRPDLTSLGIIEEPAGEAKDKTSGGKCIRGLTAGSTLSFPFKAESNARVKITGIRANYDEGFNLDSNVKFSVNQEVLKTGAVFGGHSSQTDYWPWQSIVLGDRLLTQGDYTFTIEVINSLPNFDCLSFEVTDFNDTDKYVQICQDGTTIVDVEKLNLDQWVVREDLAAAGKTKESLIEDATDAYNGKSIGGIGAGSVFSFSFCLKDDAYVKPYARRADPSAYDVDSNIQFRMDGQVVNSNGYNSFGGTEGNQYWNWKNVPLTERKLSKGFHTFTYTAIGSGINLDAFLLETSYYGKTDEKGLQIKTNGTFVREAEEIKVASGSYKVESPTGDAASLTSGGKSIGNVAKGTIFSLSFSNLSKCTINISAVRAKYEGTFSLDDNLEIRLDDEEIKTGYSSFGHTDSNQYWNWKNVSIIKKEFEAGDHVLSIEALKENCFPNTDCFTFAVSGYNDLRNIDGEGEYVYEGEDLPYLNLNFDAAGAAGRVESDSHSSRGKSLGHIQNGFIEFPFYRQDKASVDITLVLSKYEPYNVSEYYKIYRDGAELSFVDPSLTLGRAEDGSNDWFNWKEVKIATQHLEKGDHLFAFHFPTVGVNIDYYKFTISQYGI